MICPAIESWTSNGTIYAFHLVEQDLNPIRKWFDTLICLYHYCTNGHVLTGLFVCSFICMGCFVDPIVGDRHYVVLASLK